MTVMSIGSRKRNEIYVESGRKKKQIIIYPAMWNEPQKSNTIFISDAYLKYARPYAVQKIKDELQVLEKSVYPQYITN